MTPEHKQKIKEGRLRAEELRKAKPPPSGGRFSCDELGTVTILEPDLVHGMTLDPVAAALLRDFLQRAILV